MSYLTLFRLFHLSGLEIKSLKSVELFRTLLCKFRLNINNIQLITLRNLKIYKQSAIILPNCKPCLLTMIHLFSGYVKNFLRFREYRIKIRVRCEWRWWKHLYGSCVVYFKEWRKEGGGILNINCSRPVRVGLRCEHFMVLYRFIIRTLEIVIRETLCHPNLA